MILTTKAQTNTVSARQLLTNGLNVLASNYYGYSSFNPNDLQTEAERRLKQICPNPEQICDSETGAEILSDLLEELGDNHTYRASLAQTQNLRRDFAGLATPSFGLMLAPIPDSPTPIVARLRNDSPAAKAGLQRGDIVQSIDGVPVSDFKNFKNANNAMRIKEWNNQSIELGLKEKTGNIKTLRLSPQPLASWPPSLDFINANKKNIAVLTMYQFRAENMVASQVHALVRQAQEQHADALILDLRESGGGLVSEMMAVTGAFMEKPSFRLQYKTFASNFRFEQLNAQGNFFHNNHATNLLGNATRWQGPLLVLVNARSRSAPEFLAYQLQQAGRAKVFGEPSYGVLETSNQFFDLIDGSWLAVSTGRAQTPDGQAFPKRVIPDQSIPDNLLALSHNQDPMLEEAIRSFLWQP